MTDKLITRRSILRGLFACPAVVAASSLMPVRGWIMKWTDPVIYRYATFATGYEYIIDADTIRKIGEGNHAVGSLILDRIFNRPPLTPDTTPPSSDGA